MAKAAPVSTNPQWYRDAIIYELRVRSFFDANGDGIGDFQGLTQKLDYLEDLGVTALWLLPFYPSPMRDDGYDTADYTDVHPDCGTLADFKVFLDAAHDRGMKVITELVLNHTSDQHPWFQAARRAKPGSPARDFYVWSDTVEKYQDARIIFQDFEPSNWSWDPVAKQYYWHRFYAHQPDLNFENPEVKKALFKVVDFWLEMGVDGMRLDAVPYLFEREGTNCENLPETHALLKELRTHVDSNFADRMLLAEANQWPEDAAKYLDAECHMAFHFPIMPRLFMAVHMEDRFPLTDILAQTPALPENAQWAIFLRNHDELTLEMVSEEERDYMYRAYAHDQRMRVNLGIRRRLAPLLNNDRRKIELLTGLLCSLTGTPVLYYGDEIGMGDNVYLGDRDGVRTPMQWSADRNAGFSRANPQKLILPIIIDPQYHYETTNVESHEQSPHSLFWWTRRLLALRRQFKAFGRGSLDFVEAHNHKVLAFIRSYENERILVVANLSRFAEHADLDLQQFKGLVPRELFGSSNFPRIGESSYPVMLAPNAFYWFSLDNPEAGQPALGAPSYTPLKLSVRQSWDAVFTGRTLESLEVALPRYLSQCRWYGGKARGEATVTVVDTIPVGMPQPRLMLTLVSAAYADGESETYLIPLTFLTGDEAKKVAAEQPVAVVAELLVNDKTSEVPGLLVDAMSDPESCRQLLAVVEAQATANGTGGTAQGWQAPGFGELRGAKDAPLEPKVSTAQQSNTSVVFGDKFIFKLFRKVDEGVNPEVEMSSALAARGYTNTPPLAGTISYLRRRKPAMTLGVLQGLVPNQGDAWSYTMDELRRFYERAQAQKELVAPVITKSALDLTDDELTPAVRDLIGSYLEAARLLGRRTAELHLALAKPTEEPDFMHERYSTLFQRATYQSMRNLVGKTFRQLRKALPKLPEAVRAQAKAVVEQEPEAVRRFEAFLQGKVTGQRIRFHGDFHLGQALYTGKDFVLIDFEGEPMRPMVERRRKRSPLRDVAGMLRSFHYATRSALSEIPADKLRAQLEPWAGVWQAWVSRAFVNEYLATAAAGGANFLPADAKELRTLLDAFTLEKAVYEVAYELNNRPDWLGIPLKGIEQILRPE